MQEHKGGFAQHDLQFKKKSQLCNVFPSLCLFTCLQLYLMRYSSHQIRNFVVPFSSLSWVGERIDDSRNHVFIKADKVLYFIGRLHICPFFSGSSDGNWSFLLFFFFLYNASLVAGKCQQRECVLLRLSICLYLMLPVFFFFLSDNREHERTHLPGLPAHTGLQYIQIVLQAVYFKLSIQSAGTVMSKASCTNRVFLTQKFTSYGLISSRFACSYKY